MNRGAILSLLVAGLITGGYVELVTNQSDARPTAAEAVQAAQTAAEAVQAAETAVEAIVEAIDIAQSAEAVPGYDHMRAAYGGIYWIADLVVKPADTDDVREYDAKIGLAVTSFQVVAQNEAAIRDALIGVLEARIMNSSYIDIDPRMEKITRWSSPRDSPISSGEAAPTKT